jgi:prepilin-type N-terminal cleavage/methylation domain-containing protein/prepilin-type processing-associated H-X9-DG protein
MRKARGFTLVELLVVIGIIALLISILMPALSTARRNAQTVKCLSNLRQVGTAYQLYAADFKGAIPVVRQDLPDDPSKPVNDNKYWMTYVGPYVSKAKFGFEASKAADKAEAWDTVIWGCSEWTGRAGNAQATTTDTGYGMNSQFWQNPDTTGATPKTEQAMRWRTTMEGKYWKIGSIKHASERVLVGDSQLWWLYGRLSGGTGEAGLPGQPVDANAINASKVATPGLLDFDMYRHAKKPSTVNGSYWNKTGAKVACNAVYVDGHAETITGWDQAYRGIFLKAP